MSLLVKVYTLENQCLRKSFILIDHNNVNELFIILLTILCTIFVFGKFTFESIIQFLVLCSFIVIAFVDLKDMIIPDTLIIFCLGLVIVNYCVFKYAIFEQHLFKSFEVIATIVFTLIILIVTLLIHIIYKKEILGYGDIKLILIMGLMIGVTKLLIGIYIGSIVALIIQVLVKRKRESCFPFGPYLILGFVISILLVVY